MIEIKGVNILGIAGCVPKNKIDNFIFGEELFGNDIKKIIKATGIEERRICKFSETTALDLCIKGAEELLLKTKVSREDIGAVIFVTSTPEFVMPNNATLVQEKLNLPKGIIAYDINLACSGYPFGLFNAAMTVKATGKKVLLLDGDKQSHFISKEDKATSLLFADGGSATILSLSENTNLNWYFSFETDGSKHEAIIIPHGGSKNWIQKNSLEFIEKENGSKIRLSDLTMDGLGVFNFATQDVPKNLEKLILEGQLNIEDIDILALHQANKFMVRQIAKGLKISMEKTPITVGKYGNTSSSTIPILLADSYVENLSNKKILMSGFGAGLSIGSAFIETENTINIGVIEYEE
ncbi:MAG: 3-oxoacyl-ACP synthase III family protein [Cetobacterium sp.]